MTHKHKEGEICPDCGGTVDSEYAKKLYYILGNSINTIIDINFPLYAATHYQFLNEKEREYWEVYDFLRKEFKDLPERIASDHILPYLVAALKHLNDVARSKSTAQILQEWQSMLASAQLIHDKTIVRN